MLDKSNNCSYTKNKQMFAYGGVGYDGEKEDCKTKGIFICNIYYYAKNIGIWFFVLQYGRQNSARQSILDYTPRKSCNYDLCREE